MPQLLIAVGLAEAYDVSLYTRLVLAVLSVP